MEMIVRLGEYLWRPITDSAEDTEFILALRNAPDAQAAFYGSAITRESHLRFLRRPEAVDEINWIVEKNGQRAGQCGIFGINRRNRRAEAGRIVLSHPDVYIPSALVMWWVGFEHLGLNKMHGEILGSNSVMTKALERLGAVREGTLRQHFLKNDQLVDVCVYGVLASDWKDLGPRLMAQYGEPQLLRHVPNF